MTLLNRCDWANGSDEYRQYHDYEWSVPIRDDVALFERLSLEGFQAGLSWITVLRKRDAFRAQFQNFNPVTVAGFGESEIQSALANASIIRHRGKIEATINNARCLLQQWERAGEHWLCDTLQEFAPTDESLRAQGFSRPPKVLAQLPSQSAETVGLSRHLRQLGFKFVGPTTLYAGLQATGFVQDHLVSCHRFSR